MSDKKEELVFDVALALVDIDETVLFEERQFCIKPDSIIDRFESIVYSQLFEHFSGNQTKIAEALGVNRGTARTKLKKYGLIGG